MMTFRDLIWIYVIVAVLFLIPIGLAGLVWYLFGLDEHLLLLPSMFLWWGLLVVLSKRIDFAKYADRIAYGKENGAKKELDKGERWFIDSCGLRYGPYTLEKAKEQMSKE